MAEVERKQHRTSLKFTYCRRGLDQLLDLILQQLMHLLRPGSWTYSIEEQHLFGSPAAGWPS